MQIILGIPTVNFDAAEVCNLYKNIILPKCNVDVGVIIPFGSVKCRYFCCIRCQTSLNCPPRSKSCHKWGLSVSLWLIQSSGLPAIHGTFPNGVYILVEVSFFIFELLGECHCWWIKESPRAHVAKFYCRLDLIRSVLRASNFSVLKFTEIEIMWVYYTTPFDLNIIWHYLGITFQLLHLFVWLRITD